MARLDDATGKHLSVDILPLPIAADDESGAMLLSVRFDVADGIYAWENSIPALTVREARILADACLEIADGSGNGGILTTSQCVIEFGINARGIVVTFDEPLIPPEESDRVAYQVLLRPTSDHLTRFGHDLLHELRHWEDQFGVSEHDPR